LQVCCSIFGAFRPAKGRCLIIFQENNATGIITDALHENLEYRTPKEVGRHRSASAHVENEQMSVVSRKAIRPFGEYGDHLLLK
jgi:hypothetical protein